MMHLKRSSIVQETQATIQFVDTIQSGSVSAMVRNTLSEAAATGVEPCHGASVQTG